MKCAFLHILYVFFLVVVKNLLLLHRNLKCLTIDYFINMSKNLVIVESPAKAKTIGKFLGKDFTVMSSFGHIRDLKTKDISIDFKKNYAPIYEVPADKKKLVTELKKKVKESEMVWLASD